MGVIPVYRYWRALCRRKIVDANSLGPSNLARVLSTFDLTALGVGSTLGVGVYVIAGNVSKNIAGPAVVLSFLIAAVASIFAGLCYAEFGARVPRAGSAYIYSYVCVGEFIAFIIGWNLILEYVIGSASVAKGLSKYLDSLMNDTMEKTFINIAPVDADFFAMSSYFDIFSFLISIILAVALALGVKESSLVNNIFTVINILVVVFVIIAGCIKVDTKNWRLTDNLPSDAGEGGFFPFGVSGAIAGAATCFYGFVGFDCIATTGEEVKNPRRAIPIAIIGSLLIIFLSYFGVSTVLTLMSPYYSQDPDAPIPKVFAEMDWIFAQWIVTIGGIFGLTASLFGAMFPLPRIIYAMSNDGLIFKFLGQVNKRFKTPFYGTISAGLLTGLMAALFDLEKLVNMMSIGTLLAYTIVAACVLLLRYKAENREGSEVCNLLLSEVTDSEGDEILYKHVNPYGDNASITPEYVESTNLVSLTVNVSFNTVMKQIFCPTKCPTSLSSSIVAAEVLIFSIMSALLGICIIYWKDGLGSLDPFAISVTSVIAACLVIILVSISFQPTSDSDLSFKVPLVPLIPALSILINVYLMLMLDPGTWIRFGIWMLVGLLIYFLYGVKKSKAPYADNLTTKKLQTTNGEVSDVHSEDDEKPGKTNHIITPEYNSYNDLSRMSENILSQQSVVLRKGSQSKLEDEDVRKSLKYIEDLEKILDYNENLKFSDSTTSAVKDVKLLSNKEDGNVEFEKLTNENVVASCDVVPLTASVVSKPAIISLPSPTLPESAHIPQKKFVKKFSTASLYPNVIVVSYGSDTDSIDIKDHRNIYDDIDSPEDKPYPENEKDALSQELHPQNGTEANAPPTPPPLPPPLPPASLHSNSKSTFVSFSTTPPPPPLPSTITYSISNPPIAKSKSSSRPSTPPTYVTNSSSNHSSETNSLNESGYGTNSNGAYSSNKYKTEPGSPVGPDTQFLLRMGSLKNSGFAQKLEAILQEKLYVAKPVDPESKKSPKFIKNNTNPQHKSNVTEKINRPQLNENTKTKKTPMKTVKTPNEENAQVSDVDDDTPNIKWKLEKFFANRSELPVLRRPISQPNLTLMIAGENDESEDFKKLNKSNLNDSAEKRRSNLERKMIDDGKNFDTVKKQRLLMGEVLASIKFVSNKSPIQSTNDDLDLDSLSDNSEDNEEVFEDLAEISSREMVHL